MDREKLTSDFYADEFYSPDINAGVMNPNFMAKLQKLRTSVGVGFKITSGFRTKEQNDKVHGAKDSRHLIGGAADIRHVEWNGYTRRKFVMMALNQGFSVGIYQAHFHVDDRQGLGTLWIGDNVLD